uniref:Hemerythrin n=1 Tax=Arichlidon gathofi TaxID=1964502 RepID=A0A1S6QCF2_9ANNE|nr:hemerythrin [Arichlidon gathofi]
MPGHDIPEPFKWDQSFTTLYAQIDEEHRGLFDGIFNCIKGNNQGNLDALKGKIAAHFAYEEGQMQAKGYSGFTGHKKVHDDFQHELQGKGAPLSHDDVVWAKEWLVNHIKDIDFKYKGKLD